MTAPATCRHCGEQAGSTGSLSGLVHRWGPKDHRFEPLPTAEQSNAVVERMIAAETTILSTPATHPCDACGGRGDNIVTTAFGRRARECAGKHSWSRVARSSDRNVWICSHCQGERVWQRCPVCLGAGSFPDRMPARDALADAETLRIAVAWSTMGPNRASRASWGKGSRTVLLRQGGLRARTGDQCRPRCVPRGAEPERG